MVTKLGDVTFGNLVAVSPRPADPLDDKEWDSNACEWLPKGTLERRAASARHNRRLRDFAATGCKVSDSCLEAIADATLRETTAVLAVAEFMHERSVPWLVLSGSPGCGKSIAAANVLWVRSGRWVRGDELVRLFASMFGDQYEQQQALRDARLLVIDDVGCELDAQRMLPALLDLLDSRKSARNTPTIVTTNLNKKQFAERYANDRLTSRMHESVLWVGLTNGDLRREVRERA